MGKERKSQRERRDIYFKLREGTLVRRKPSDLELSTYFKAIDHRDLNAFGVRALVEIDLNVLDTFPSHHTGPQTHNVGFEKRVTILSYAAWRRRAHLIKQLLVAGASPTVSDRAPNGCLSAEDEEAIGVLLSRRFGSGVDSATACFIIETICRMRCVAARDVALGAVHPPCVCCGTAGMSVCFDPCGCVVCESCVWRAVLHPNGSAAAAGAAAPSDEAGGAEARALGEVCCPSCDAPCPMRGHGAGPAG